jgi:hypothetical protein
MVFLRNMCVDTVRKGDKDVVDDDDIIIIINPLFFCNCKGIK